MTDTETKRHSMTDTETKRHSMTERQRDTVDKETQYDSERQRDTV